MFEGMNGKGWVATAGVVALTVAGARGQAVLDDLEGGNSINKFGGQWNFSGDFWDKGDSKILSAVDTSVEVPFFKGAYGGGYPDGTGNAAELHFRFGTVKPGTPPDTYDNNVSMNCPLGADDALLNLTGAQSITFQAKADKALQVEMILPTANITDYAYYTALIHVGTAWTEYTIKLATGAGGLTRRNFGVNQPLDLAQAQAVGWEVNKGKNGAITEATLWIDDVSIQAYTFVAPEPRGSCVAAGCVKPAGSAPKPAALLADFEGAGAPLNAVGNGWNFGPVPPMDFDAEPSRITEGVDSANFALAVQGRGYGGGGGAMIGFELGDSWFTPEGFLQLPAVNLSTTLAIDSNLDATGSTGLYFDYKTAGNVDYVDLKVKTDQIHAENIYAIAFAKLKGTGGEWKGAWVKWTDFVLPNWGAAFKEAEKLMRFTSLYGLEWSVTSPRKDVNGSVAIDNLYLTGIAELPKPVSSALHRAAQGRAPRTRFVGGALEIPFTAPAGSHVGTVRVLDAMGRELARQAFVAAGASGSVLQVHLGAGIPRGLAMVRVDSRYGDGRSFTASWPAVNLE